MANKNNKSVSTGPVRRNDDYARPRRPEQETINYLRSLPLSAQEEDNLETDIENNDFPTILTAALSALYEVRHELASLAGHEHSSQIIERLARIVGPASAVASRLLLHAVGGYALFLATHRYGSHVLQTVLEQSVQSQQEEQDWALHPDAPVLEGLSDLPSLEELLMAVQQELTPHAWDLSVHVCGAHVLRTLVCVLGGVTMLTPGSATRSVGHRRGKQKKRKKAKEQDHDSLGTLGNSTLRVTVTPNSRISTTDPTIERALLEMVTAISGDSVAAPGDLQELVCHPSCGPLLIVLLRVLTYRESSEPNITEDDNIQQSARERHLALMRPEPKFTLGSAAHKLVQRLLCWKDGSEKQEWAHEVIYGLAGDPRGSHCLEAILHVAPDDVYESIFHLADWCTAKTLQEYSNDNVSSFVVQSIIGTVRSEKQAKLVIEGLLPLVADGFFLKTENRRVALLWRLVECAAKHHVCQHQVHSSMLKGFSTFSSPEIRKMRECVPVFIGLRKPEKDGDRVTLNAPGARTLYWLLRFEPSLCEPILKGIARIPSDELELLCKDGLGSHCIVDGMLDGPLEEKVFENALSSMVGQLSGRWTAIASDRIGHHVAQKLFRNVPSYDKKETLVKELVEGKRRMSGSNMSRTVMTTCFAREYETQGSTEWRRLVRKSLEKGNWLKDISRSGAVSKRKDGIDKRKGYASSGNPNKKIKSH